MWLDYIEGPFCVLDHVNKQLLLKALRFLLMLGENGLSVKIWLSSHVINEACKSLTRNLTLEEWKEYIPIGAIPQNLR